MRGPPCSSWTWPTRFTSQVTVAKDGPEPIEVDGKSVMQMITLEATKGTVLHVKRRGRGRRGRGGKAGRVVRK